KAVIERDGRAVVVARHEAGVAEDHRGPEVAMRHHDHPLLQEERTRTSGNDIGDQAAVPERDGSFTSALLDRDLALVEDVVHQKVITVYPSAAYLARLGSPEVPGTAFSASSWKPLASASARAPNTAAHPLDTPATRSSTAL